MNKWKYTNVANELNNNQRKCKAKTTTTTKDFGHSTSKHDIKPYYNNSMAKTIQLALFASPYSAVFAGETLHVPWISHLCRLKFMEKV